MLIVSESQRRVRQPNRAPASEIYSGVYFRVLKKYIREGILKDVDILILTKEFGLIPFDKPLDYTEPSPGQPGKLALGAARINEIRQRNIKIIEKRMTSNSYGEVYVNVGREFRKLLEGIENLGINLTFSQGAGLGPKAAHMKGWILSQPRSSALEVESR